MKKPAFLLFAFLTLFFSSSAALNKREMRAVWIATVANIDWPDKPGQSVNDQKREMINLLDSLAMNNINTIIVQIRPTADAFYPSMLEPWSQWLTGKQGRRPDPFYDPLKFIIDEAHKRCIEVHAWLNPYRITNSDDLSQLSKSSFCMENRNLMVHYGGKYYFDPGMDETRIFLNKVVQDIVEHYDIDAIHLDDYFYPYRVNGQDFPDDTTFKKYPRGFSPSQKADWRRNNVNMIVEELQQTIKSLKPWVEFGISPFGVWRNSSSDSRGSATTAGVQNYDDLYADILKWLQDGTIDYVVPQLYWEIGKKAADYAVLAKWWSDNSFGKNLYIGLYASKLGTNDATPAWRNGNELIRQMRMNEQFPQIDGVAFFSAKPFLKNKQALNDSLRTGIFRYPALTPVNRNIKGDDPAQPQNLRILRDGSAAYLMWDKVNEDGGCATAYYVVYAFKGRKIGDLDNPANILVKTTENCIDLRELGKKMRGPYSFVVTAVNRYKHESTPVQGVERRL